MDYFITSKRSTTTKNARKMNRTFRQTISFKNMAGNFISNGNNLTEAVILEYASCLAEDGKIAECLEVIYYAVKIFQTTITVDKIIPVVTKLIAKLRTEAKIETYDTRKIYSCPSCTGVLYEPITIPCGHTVCKRCLNKDDSIICNTCHIRYVTIKGREYCTNILINSLVDKFWGDEVLGASLRAQGNKLFEENKYEESLQIYTGALNHAPNDHLLLANRSHVLLTLKKPEKALEDANAVLHRRPLWAEGHFRRATALLALRREEEAHVAMLLCATVENSTVLPRVGEDMATMLLKTMQQDCCSSDEWLKSEYPKPVNTHSSGLGHPEKNKKDKKTKKGFPKFKNGRIFSMSKSFATQGQKNLPVGEVPIVRRIISKYASELKHSKRKGTKDDRMIDLEKIVKSDFECTLCYQYFWHPVTTPCGHTFCQACLNRCLDHTPTCPLCKSSLIYYLAERSSRTTEFIEEVMKKCLPKEYEERNAQNEKDLRDFSRGDEIPIFVATVAIPGIVCPLHVYEPRYRLMIRRCIEAGTRQFGMCMPSDTEEHGYANYGTMLEIKSIKYTPDGRSIINTIGGRRFKCISKGMKDGYHTAVAEFLQDDEISTSSLDGLKRLHNSINSKANSWFHSIENTTQNRILGHYGPMPLVEADYWKLKDGPSWLWWLIAVLPLEPQIQVKIISKGSLSTRLGLISRTLRCIYLHQSKSRPLSSSTL